MKIIPARCSDVVQKTGSEGLRRHSRQQSAPLQAQFGTTVMIVEEMYGGSRALLSSAQVHDIVKLGKADSSTILRCKRFI
jgi:hypothetical protein